MISVNVGGHAVMGRRSYMEDRFGIFPEVAPECSVLFVADGHGGSYVAEFVYANLENTIQETCKESIGSHGECSDDIIKEEMEKMFAKLNENLKTASNTEADGCGSTLVVAILFPTKVVIANCGDSKALWVNYTNNSFNFTCEHNANNESEIDRVLQSGGYVWNKRLYGSLSVFRAIGDFQYEPVMSCIPDVYIIDRSEVNLLVLCTDGVYEALSEDMMIQLINKITKKNLSEADKIARVVVNTAIKMNSSDNITSLVSLIS